MSRVSGILILLIFSIHAAGQIITVHSEFEQDSVLLGKQLRYRISAEAGRDVYMQMPQFRDSLTREIEILRTFPADTIYEGERKTIQQEYLVTSFEPGWNTVPPQPVYFESDVLSDTAYTAALLLTVLSPVVDTTQAIKAIKPPVNTPISFAEVFPWLLLALGIIGIGLLGWYFYRRYKMKKEHPELYAQKVLEPAHIVAFKQLDELKKAKLPQAGMVKDYYSRLTEIIRIYMSRQFDIHAMESTSSEILDAFSMHPATGEILGEQLEDLLMLADLVKFAKEDPLMEENEKHFTNAYNFVKNTYSLFEVESSDDRSDTLKDEDADVPLEREEVKHA